MSESIFDSFPVLNTERLILRQIQMNDAAALYACFADEEVTRFYNLPTFSRIEQAQGIIEHMLNSYGERRTIRWAITRREDGLFLGTCGFTGWKWHFFSGQIGYELSRPFWRQGVMTEALTAVIRLAFTQLNLNRVEALVMPGNTASLNLLKKLDFQNEGLLRQSGYWENKFHDLYMMALLKRDWALQEFFLYTDNEDS
ncbi:MAG: GNAT family N-acetyltransferase [Ardenticatenaceae bacterium]|nr:GNAT family N-acetyltransferase [Ardenticatenaceae bacterium]MCB9443359.1 GNAT family N-acetyltransferase [Ardenticatenaceae bacterium]